jgi:quinol monooxygenase YgiN
MILIAGTVRFPPETMAEARPAMARMITATRAEDGCLQYAFAEDVLDPGLIHISELWRDRAALDAHGAAPHMAEWRAAGRTLGIHGRDLRLYEVGEASPL